MSMSIFIKKGIPNDIRYVYEVDWDKHNTCLLPIHEESVHIVSVEAFQNWISALRQTKFGDFHLNHTMILLQLT